MTAATLPDPLPYGRSSPVTPTGAVIPGVLEAFQVYLLTFERLLPRTVGTYLHHLRQVLTALPSGVSGAITPEQLREWLTRETDRGISNNTLRVQLFSLRAYYRWLTHTGYTGPCPLDEVRPPRRPDTERTAYTEAEAYVLLTAARAAAREGRRRDEFDYALLATLRYTEVRRTELLDLRTSDLSLDRRRLRILGKGQRVRTIAVPPVYTDLMAWYLSDVRPALPRSEALFANPSAKTGTHRGATAEKTVERVTHKYGNLTGVGGPHHPHRWRHTYATQLLRSGVDVYMVKKLLGHANLNTTVIYLHLMVDDLHHGVDRAFQ